jgi:hypothetical protein
MCKRAGVAACTKGKKKKKDKKEKEGTPSNAFTPSMAFTPLDAPHQASLVPAHLQTIT